MGDYLHAVDSSDSSSEESFDNPEYEETLEEDVEESGGDSNRVFSEEPVEDHYSFGDSSHTNENLSDESVENSIEEDLSIVSSDHEVIEQYNHRIIVEIFK